MINPFNFFRKTRPVTGETAFISARIPVALYSRLMDAWRPYIEEHYTDGTFPAVHNKAIDSTVTELIQKGLDCKCQSKP